MDPVSGAAFIKGIGATLGVVLAACAWADFFDKVIYRAPKYGGEVEKCSSLESTQDSKAE